MSKRGRGDILQSLAAAAAKTQQRGNADLFMECVDEDLAPSQQEAKRRAATEYQTAVQQVEKASMSVADMIDSQPVSKSAKSLGHGRSLVVRPATIAVTASMSSSQPFGTCTAPRARGRPPKTIASASLANTQPQPVGRSNVLASRRGRPPAPRPKTFSAVAALANATAGLTAGRGRGCSQARGGPTTATNVSPRGRGRTSKKTSAPAYGKSFKC